MNRRAIFEITLARLDTHFLSLGYGVSYRPGRGWSHVKEVANATGIKAQLECLRKRWGTHPFSPEQLNEVRANEHDPKARRSLRYQWPKSHDLRNMNPYIPNPLPGFQCLRSLPPPPLGVTQ